MADVRELGEAIVKSVTALVERAFAKAEARITEVDQTLHDFVRELRGDLAALAARRPEPGEKGLPGERGEKGDPGADGTPGEKGDPGEPGVPGQDGSPGAPGTPGEKGDPGDVGSPGINGKDGLDGAPGLPGGKGDPGEKGDPGINGKDGAPGADGKPGINGEKGDPGLNGADGRDALEITIQASIEPHKSYQRGTYATHRGGLWRSLRKTDPLSTKSAEEAGWAIVVDGVDSVKFLQTDDRNFDLITNRSSGAVEKLAVRFDVPLYRQVYKGGDRYEKSDMVTYAGSVWMALADDPNGPPDMVPTDWRLIVKRGRDGKDGKDGLRGEKGAPGDRGRDLTSLGPDGSRLR